MSPFARLAGYLRRYRGAYVRGLLAVGVTSAFALFAPWVLQHAIDDLGREVTAAKLAFYGALLIALAVVGGWFRFSMRHTIIGASRDIEYDVRNDFFAHLQRLPLAYFQTRRTGDLMSRAINDLESVRLMVGISVVDAANTGLIFIVAIVLMLAIDRRLTLVALAPLPFVSLSVRYFGRAMYSRFQQIQAELSEMTALAQETLTGVKVIKAYGQEDAQIDRFRAATRAYFYRNRSLIRIQSIFYATMVLCLGMGSVLVLWLGSRDVIRGHMSLGQFVAFNAYQVMLSLPMIAFGSVTNTVQRGIASWKRMVEVFDVPPAVDGEPQAGLGVAVRGEIEVRNLSFAFDGKRVLEEVSFHVPAGRKAAIVGPTGSGKSTLLSLLPRLHDPPRGSIFLDGVDVRDIPLDLLRGAIGFVPQEPFLFSDTIAENIALAPGAGGRDEVDDPDRERTADILSGGVDLRGAGSPYASPDSMQAVRRASAIARLDQEVAGFPQGYDTPLGERGVTLSGGQRQRTALARAVIVDAPILVLDDALSAVDARTEEEILAELQNVTAGRTALIVSNRVSTVRDADLILVLDGGRIAERGRHAELVARRGLYADLYRKQLLQDALAAS